MAFHDAPIILRKPDAPKRQYGGDWDATEGDTAATKRIEMGFCKTCFDILADLYPGHPWIVRCDSKAKLVSVQLALVMDSTRWFNIHADKIGNAMELRAWMMKAGGEILERFGMRRSGPMDVDHFQHVKKTKRLLNHSDKMPEG